MKNVSQTLVCFGDSVTQGVPHCAPEDTFPALLERRLNWRYAPQLTFTVHNAGVGGENTVEALARLDESVLTHRPDLVTVEFGLNDIRYDGTKRVYEEEFAANLRTIHGRLTAAGAQVVLMTPNPIVDCYHEYSKGTDYYAPWGGCNGACAAYAAIIRQVAADLNCALCDIYAAFVRKAIEAEFRGETCNWSDLRVLGGLISTRDGVHPTAAGQELIAAELYALLVGGRLFEFPD